MNHLPQQHSSRPSYMGEAYAALRSEYLLAWQQGPAALVRTPGYGKPQHTLAALVAEDMGGQPLHALVFILRDGANGQDVALRCSAWIAECAARHASFHADDLAAEIEAQEERDAA